MMNYSKNENSDRFSTGRLSLHLFDDKSLPELISSQEQSLKIKKRPSLGAEMKVLKIQIKARRGEKEISHTSGYIELEDQICSQPLFCVGV